MNRAKWLKAQVKVGEQVGRTLGFPTVNLSPTAIPKGTKQGVYASIVTIHDRVYKGALFYGPRLVKGEVEPVLEIYILDFDGYLYGALIEFQLRDFIREPGKFDSFEELKKAMTEDVGKVDRLVQL